MKLIHISDTHNKHKQLSLPECDVLVHTGDESSKGFEREIRDFASWFNKQKAEHLIWVPGNHSVSFEKEYPQSLNWFKEECPNGYILIHQEVIINGIKFFGSPYTPRFFNWAYNVDRGNDIARLWSQIPDDTNVLLTHGPPHGILDPAPKPFGGFEPVGCRDLLNRISELKSLKLHCFGHLHSGNGIKTVNGVTFMNSSICDESYNASQKYNLFDFNL